MKWVFAPELHTRIRILVQKLEFKHVDPERLFVFRSFGSKARARARIWSLPTIWQQALNVSASYCIEVISEHFDNLSPKDQEHTLVHELLHIPKTFSGALLSHTHRGGRVDRRTVEQLIKKFLK